MAQPNDANWKGAFTDTETHPLVLNLMLLKAFGPEYLGWEPETIWHEIQQTYGVTVADANKQKIEAVRSVYVSDKPGDDWTAFEIVAAGLLGIPPRAGVIQRCPPSRAGFALECLLYLRDPSYVKPEVYRYCAACLMDYGLVYGPATLEEANQYVVDADKELQNQVRYCVARGRAISQNMDVQVQAEKALAVKETLLALHAHFVGQIKQYGL